ncbi:MAG: hypothetical protein ACRC06_13370 [Waterburya sp.]
MLYKLLSSLQGSGIIALILLTTNTVQANPKEYVFSAPPESNQELVEIPTRKTEYPFYECNLKSEVENNHNAVLIDSHNCDCVDCENSNNLTQERDKNEHLTSQNKQTRQ